MSINRIINAEGDKKLVIQEAMNAGLIARTASCGVCGNQMREPTRDPKVQDGWRWRCCRIEKTIKVESFFKDSNVSFPKWMRFIVAWSRDQNYTIENLKNAAPVGKTAAKSMLKCVRDMCDRSLYDESDATFLGGNGASVVIVPTTVRCKSGHDILLFHDGAKCFLAHHQNMPLKEGSSVFTDIVGLQLPNSCFCNSMANNTVVGYDQTLEDSARWLQGRRGIECGLASSTAAEYVFRRHHFTGNIDGYADIFLHKLRAIYQPVLANV